MNFFIALIIAVLFGTGIYLVLHRDILKVAFGFGLISHAVNIFIVASGILQGNLVPIIVTKINENAGFIFTDDIAGRVLGPVVTGYTEDGLYADPLPQALVLTAIVISLATTAVLLTLAYHIDREFGTTDTEALGRMKG